MAGRASTTQIAAPTDFAAILSQNSITPVLVDVGASGEPPAIWNSIAAESIYIGFDPDLREIYDIPESKYRRAVIVNEAMTANSGEETVRFYLTSSPYCSSTLLPDEPALSSYIFSDLFVVERDVTVRANTLDGAMDRLGVEHIDWLKLDTQGTDLRLATSLSSKLFTGLLAVEIEPGLIDAYLGEDLFVDSHRNLCKNGFWMSNANVQGTTRMRRSTVDTLNLPTAGITAETVERVVKKAPCWCEARYFRTVEWLGDHDAEPRSYILLWVFAMIDKHYGYALDLAVEYQRRFGADKVSDIMRSHPIARIAELVQSANAIAAPHPGRFIPRRVRRWLRRIAA